MRHYSPHPSISLWVVSILATLLLLPVSMLSAETAPGCETPETLETQPLVAVAQHWDAVILPSGAFTFNEETEFLNEAGDPVELDIFAPGDLVIATVCREESPTETPTPEAKPNLPIMGVLLSLQQASDTSVTPTPTPNPTATATATPTPTPVSATITGEILEMVTNDGCFRLRPMQLEEPGEEETTESLPSTNGLLVCTTSATVIQAEDGTALTYDDLAAGNLVEVVLDISIAAPQQYAQQITVLEQDPPEPFEIEGTIEAIRPNSTNTGGHIRVMETLITIDQETVLVDADDTPIVFADLEVGQRVFVKGEQDPYSFNVKATEVVLLEAEPQVIVIEGEIEELLPLDTTVCGMLRVDETLLMLSGDSQIVDAEGNRLSLSSLNVGDEVRVEAIDNGMDCGLLVLKLQVITSNPPLNTITGVIAEINDADQCFVLVPTWNQPDGEEASEESKRDNRYQICTTSDTTYEDPEGNVITFAGLAVKDSVEVTLQADAASRSWIAASVVVLPPPAPPAQTITGLISEIDTTNSTIVVTPESAEKVITSITLIINNDTLIIDIRGDQLTLDELQVGDEVTALYETGADTTTFIATKVVKLNIAQDPIVVEGEIKSIRSIGDDSNILSMVVDNVHFLVTGETNIHDTEDNPVAAADLKRGDRVEAIGLFEFGEKYNALTAIEITLLEAAAPPMAELKGTISEIDSTTGCFEMNNELSPLAVQFNVCTNDETVIQTKDGDVLAFADLEQGDRVHVVGEADTTTSAVMAKQITVLENETPTEEITGPIREIAQSENDFDLGYLIIFNHRIAINVNTVITDKEGNELPFDALRVGQIVKITLVTDKENDTVTLVAEEVVVLEEFEIVPVDFEGVIQGINVENMVLVVKGNRVQVEDNTVIVGIDGEAITFDDLERGDYVHVNGVRNRFNHKVTALEIQVLEDPVVVGPEVEIKGVISEVDLENSQLIVKGRPIFIDENTVILDRENQLVTIEDLAVGMKVEVEGTAIPSFAPPTPIQATKVEVEGIHRLDFHVRGELTALDEDLWTVGETTFLVNDDTKFHSVDGTELTAEDFEAGDYIVANGYKVPGETPVAKQVVLSLNEEPEDICRPNIAFSGPVEVIDLENSFIVVDGKTVLVMDYTHLVRTQEGPVTLEDIEVGELANVKAEGSPDATEVTACMIQIMSEVPPPAPQDHRIVGTIDSITTETMTLIVRETTVQVTDETKIVARRDGELTFDDLAVGQMVDVKGQLNDEEVLVAAKIRVQEENVDPRPLRPIAGLIQAIDLPTSMTVANKSVQLTDETEFQGLGEEVIDPATLAVGEAVIVLLDNEASDAEADPPVLVAKKVKLIANVIEAIDLTLKQITIDGTPIAVVDETIIIDFPREAITLEDLSVGDLVKVRLFDTEPFPREASHIIRIATPDLSERIGDMGEARHGRDRGRPTISNTDPENSFGFISMPIEMEAADANTLYELKMNVATTETDLDKIPAFRARVNMANYEKASSLVVNSRGSYAYAPTEEGRDYGLLFMPPAELEVENEDEAFFFASLDLLSFEPRFGRDVTLILNSLDVQSISADRINSVQTLLLDEFVAGTDGWTFGSGGDVDLPRHGTESGTLSMGPVSNNCFGFWMKDTGITVQPGTIYRARFLVSTNIDAAEQVPTFRLRLNTSNYELAATATIEPTGTAQETLQPEARLYDIYLIVPDIDPGTDTILASLDLMGFRSETDLDSVITLEQFLLEEVEVTD